MKKKLNQNMQKRLLKIVALFTVSLSAGCALENQTGQFEFSDGQSTTGLNQIEYTNQKVNLDLTAMAGEDELLYTSNQSVFDQKGVSQMKSSAFSLPEKTKLTVVRKENCDRSDAKNLNDQDQFVMETDSVQADQLKIKAYTIQLKKKSNLENLARKFNQNPCVLEVSASTAVYPTAVSITNDTLAYRQDQLPAVRADEGLKKLFPNLTPTQKIVVAVVDTGVEYTHEDLKTVMWKNSKGDFGYNFAELNRNPMDDNGHGTHVAGLIGAQGNNRLGVRGILPSGAQIMAVKVFPKIGTGNLAAIINGIRWSADQGAQVINLSLAGPGSSTSMRSALRYAVQKGAVVLAAAGNNNLDLAKTFFFPAGYGKDIAGMITVGSFDSIYKDRSSFSNYNTTHVELSSPGSNGIHSTYIGNRYVDLQGTSMATPVAAGAAALAISYLKSKGKSYTPASIENLLKDSAVKSKALAPFVKDGNALDVSKMADLLLKM